MLLLLLECKKYLYTASNDTEANSLRGHLPRFDQKHFNEPSLIINQILAVSSNSKLFSKPSVRGR